MAIQAIPQLQGGTTTVPSARKISPQPATLDPLQLNAPTLAAPAPAAPQPTPAPTGGPNVNPIPSGASAIQQLPDGAGGAVTVPPASMAPASVVPPTNGSTLVNGQYSVNGKATPLPASNGALPAGQGADTNPYVQGGSGTTGMLDWGLPGSGLGTAADPTGAAQRAAGYIPWDPNTNGPVATDVNSPLYLSGRLPLANGQFVDGHSVTAPTHPSAQVVPFGQENAGQSMAGQPLLGGAPAVGVPASPGYGPQAVSSAPPSPAARPLSPSGGASDVSPSIPVGGGLASLGGSAPFQPPPASDVRPSIPASGGTAAGGPPVDRFTADNNLLDAQINPTASARLMNTQGMTDAQLQKILGGPDRVALGQQYYDTFAKRASSQFGRDMTDATNNAAAHGQIGSGMLTNRYGDLAEKLNLDNTTAASDFATNALQGTISDNLNNYGAARNAENSIYSQDANNRNELRGERGYQQSLAEQAIARRIAQQQAEQGQQQQDFANGASLYGIGNANDPTGAYQTAAGQASSEAGANNADVAALIKILAQRQNPVPSYYGGA